MYNEDYIRYLNTLHNVGAKNENAIAEASQNSPFYNRILVERPIVEKISKWLIDTNPHIIIITGHAGDGKTSLLIQVLNKLNVLDGTLKPSGEVVLSNGNKCVYIKDFSEFSSDGREKLLTQCLNNPKNGKHVILVANTGPLLNTFSKVLGKDAQIKLINAIDSNEASIESIRNFEIRTLNIANIDNSSFVKQFLKNIISSKNFDGCNNCPKKRFCPILFNRDIVYNNQIKTLDFLYHHFIWQQEHGKRLTIRQIIAQITYSLTAGLECSDIKNQDSKKYLFDHLFSNTLFGYKGTSLNTQALAIQAISDINLNGYDHKNLVSDEKLFILNDYSKLHPRIQEIISGIESEYINPNKIEWVLAIRRMYILFNIETDERINDAILRGLFSNKFPRYLELRSGKTPSNADTTLIVEAFSILHTGYASKSYREIPITLKRSSGIDQSVQLLYGVIYSRDIKLETMRSASSDFGDEEIYELYIKIRGEKIHQPISLPLLNYFDDIKNGVISTNIDPQLTHGIDSIKAQMLSHCMPDSQSESIEMIVMWTQEWKSITLQEDNGNYVVTNY